MKTPEEFLRSQEDLSGISSIGKLYMESNVIQLMRDYGLHIAAEQDKITRHAAAELCLEVQHEIMNLQTKIKSLDTTNIKDEEDDIYCCSNCGSTDVETKRWVNINNSEIMGTCSDEESEDNYCNNCDGHYNIITVKEFKDKK